MKSSWIPRKYELFRVATFLLEFNVPLLLEITGCKLDQQLMFPLHDRFNNAAWNFVRGDVFSIFQRGFFCWQKADFIIWSTKKQTHLQRQLCCFWTKIRKLGDQKKTISGSPKIPSAFNKVKRKGNKKNWPLKNPTSKARSSGPSDLKWCLRGPMEPVDANGKALAKSMSHPDLVGGWTNPSEKYESNWKSSKQSP